MADKTQGVSEPAVDVYSRGSEKNGKITAESVVEFGLAAKRV